MNYKETADEIYAWALKQPRASVDWQKHSEDVAKICFEVAKRAGLDENLAYAKGLLHDIYKSIERDNEVLVDGEYKLTHPFTGYRFLMDKNLPELARNALTHTFYCKEDVENGVFDFELREEDKNFLKEWLCANEYDEYDKLVQLADNMASWKGIMTIDDRFCDILMRHPVPNPQSRLRTLYKIKDYFDKKIDGNIYELFKEDIIYTAIMEPTRKAFFKNDV